MKASFSYNGFCEATLFIGAKEWNEEDAKKIGYSLLNLEEMPHECTDLEMACIFRGWLELLCTHDITSFKDEENPTITLKHFKQDLTTQCIKLITI